MVHAKAPGARYAEDSGKPGYLNTYFLALLTVIFTVFMILKPDIAFSSAVEGLKVWWEIVFPALLPFFIGSEILMGLGVVHFMGVLLEPLMRPLFNVPGAGSFVMAMGLASGYPIGAVLTARLRKQELCNRIEAERLMSACNTADPLFMSGAVSVGMFGLPGIGPVIMVTHYLSSVTLGFMMRFYARNAPRSRGLHSARSDSMLHRAFRALVDARAKDGRPLGRLLGDAVRQSVNTLLVIGGFIMLFSVIIGMMEAAGILSAISRPIEVLLKKLALDPSLSKSFVGGLFEITIGAQDAARCGTPLIERIMAASAVIAWSGLSVHAQVAAMIQGTDIRMNAYVAARFIHAILAAAYAPIIVRLLAPALEAASRATFATAKLGWTDRLNLAAAIFLVVFGLLVLFGVVACLARARAD